MANPDLTAHRLRELLSYDPETGAFTWRIAPLRRIHVGDIAGSTNDQGYVRLCLSNRRYSAHRTAWLYMTGAWPEHEIDHLNGVRGDNRWSNLRDVTKLINQQNRRKPNRDNSSGLLCAFYLKQRGLWTSSLYVDGKRISLGSFKTAEEAHAAYVAAKRKTQPGNTL